MRILKIQRMFFSLIVITWAAIGLSCLQEDEDEPDATFLDMGEDSAQDAELDRIDDIVPDSDLEGDTAEGDLPATDADTAGDPAQEEDGSVEGLLIPRFDPEGEGFYRMPWPSDYRIDEDGHPELSDFPRATDFTVETYVEVMEQEVYGFSTMPVIYVSFEQAVGTACLPEPKDTLNSDSPIQLVRLDDTGCGERIPIEIQFEIDGDTFLDANTLKAAPVPGFPLEPSSPYGLVVMKSFGAQDDLETARPALFSEIIEGAATDLVLSEVYTPLIDCAETAGLQLEDIAVATVFTTQDPVGELRLMRDQVVDSESTAAPVVRDWVLSTGGTIEDRFTTYMGKYDTPIFQTGSSPYATSGGGPEFDESGEPIVQRWEEVPFAVSVPAIGTAPYPVIIWEPGTGSSLLGYTRSPVLADALDAGLAVASFAPQFHSGRGPSGADPDLHSFNYINPEAGRTVFRQQAVDTAYFVRVVREAFGPLEELPELDTSTLVYVGHSQGAIVGALIAGVESEFAAYVLNGIGAYLAITIIERKDPEDINATIQALLGLSEPLDRFHPLVALAQLGGDVVDPINYAPSWQGWAESPHGSSLLLINGMLDVTSPVRGLNAMTISGDVQPIAEPGWDVDPFNVWEVEPTALPIQGNRISLGGDPLTIATHLVATTGHGTIYQREDIRARAIRFLRSALDGVPILTEE